MGSARDKSLGMHVGLLGSITEMNAKNEAKSAGENRFGQRESGMIVGVNVMDAREEQIAIRILRSFGASHIEYSEGKIVNGEWTDFNPIAIPKLIDPIE